MGYTEEARPGGIPDWEWKPCRRRLYCVRYWEPLRRLGILRGQRKAENGGLGPPCPLLCHHVCVRQLVPLHTPPFLHRLGDSASRSHLCSLACSPPPYTHALSSPSQLRGSGSARRLRPLPGPTRCSVSGRGRSETLQAARGWAAWGRGWFTVAAGQRSPQRAQQIQAWQATSNNGRCHLCVHVGEDGRGCMCVLCTSHARSVC